MAAVASVSVAAVSRYLNGTLALAPATAARVDGAVARLGYTPNQQARRLSLGRTNVIALIIPELSNPFFARLADATQQEAEAQGFELLISTTRNQSERERDCLARMRRDRADGVLFVTNHADDGSLAALLDCQVPTVLLDEDVTGAAVPKLFVDNLAGGRMAAEHLIAQGHRRFAILGGPAGMLSTQERHGGFHAATATAGCAVVFEDFSDYTIPAGRGAAERMLDAASTPTAVFATSDETALGLLEAARLRGVGIPDALSIVAFDDIAPWHLFTPPISAIRQPVEAIAATGVRLLLASIREQAPPLGPPPEPRPVQRLPVDLIVRGSVTPPRTTPEEDSR